jgi:uncharacterized OsmC-like protein
VSDQETIRSAFERNIKAVSLRPSLGQGTAVTRVRITDGMTCEVKDGRWSLVADMGEKSGGAGAGPDPGVFGRSALGTCLAVGYVMWAARAQVPVDGVEVEIQADYDVRGEYGVDDVQPGYRQIRYLVTITSDAPEEDLLRVIEEADSHSPYLTLYRQPQDIQREVRVARAAR